MRHASLTEYILIALVVVLAVLWAATELAPVFNNFNQASKIIGFALTGAK